MGTSKVEDRAPFPSQSIDGLQRCWGLWVGRRGQGTERQKQKITRDLSKKCVKQRKVYFGAKKPISHIVLFMIHAFHKLFEDLLCAWISKISCIKINLPFNSVCYKPDTGPHVISCLPTRPDSKVLDDSALYFSLSIHCLQCPSQFRASEQSF